MPEFSNMAFRPACSTTTMTESHEEPTVGATSGAYLDHDSAINRARTRRRHSTYEQRTWSTDREDVQVMVDEFLGDLGQRLKQIEKHGYTKIDEGMTYAYETLRAVHDSCAQVGDDIIDAGRRRAKVLAETFESHYRGALMRKETLEQKVQEGVRLGESLLNELDRRASDVRRTSVAETASEMLSTGKAYLDEAAEIMKDVPEMARKAKDTIQDKIEAAITLARKQGTITYEHLPEPWRVNPHILRGYRFNESYHQCIHSCFTTFSNETFNIWSHAIGLIIILGIAFYIYPSTPAFTESTKFDIAIAGLFFFAAAKCLVCSTMWHAMSSHSNQTIMERFACVDYTGISLLVAASIMTTEYTAFYCEPVSRAIYLSATLLLGISGSILPWHPTFNRADMAWARVGFFVTLASTGFLPVIQLTLQRSWAEASYFYAPIMKSILVYLGGAILYAMKVPERWIPGAFDYVGGSHNIWHMAVLGGILFHYAAMQSFFSEAFRRAGDDGCSVY